MRIVVRVKDSTKNFLLIISYALLIGASIFFNHEYAFQFREGMIFLLLLIFSCLVNKGLSFKLTTFRVLTLLYCIVLTYSTLTSTVVGYSPSFRSTMLIILTFILVCEATPTQKQFNTIKRIWIYYAIVACLFTCFNAVSSGGLFSVDRGSFVFITWTKDVNYFVHSILPAGYFAMRNFMFREYGKKSIVDIVCFVLVAIVILMLQTRASFLSFIIATLILMLEYIIQTKLTIRKFAVMCIGPLLCIVIIVLVVSNPAFERLTDSDGYSDNVRLRVWEAAMKAYYDSPWIGSGLNASNTYSYAQEALVTHNNFLDILGDSGIIGCVIFGLLLLSMLKVQKKHILHMLGMMIAFLLPMAFINGFQTITFWLPMIFMAHQSNIFKSDKKDVIVNKIVESI